MPFFTMSLRNVKWSVWHTVFLLFCAATFIILCDLHEGGWLLSSFMLVILPGMMIVSLIDRAKPTGMIMARFVELLRFNYFVGMAAAYILIMVLFSFFTKEFHSLPHKYKLLIYSTAFFLALFFNYNESNREKRDYC